MRKFILLSSVALCFLAGCSFGKTKVGANASASSECDAAREFITVLEFMRAHPEFDYPEKDSQKLATTVAQGCRGAAHRYIRVIRLLTKAGLGSRDAAALAVEFSRRSDADAESFVEVFRRSFLAEYLDLDLATSVALARGLSSQFKGDSEVARNDFKEFVGFCVDTDTLDLPRPRCAKLSAELAQKSEKSGRSVFKPFVRAYQFLRSTEGPGLSIDEAISVGQSLIGVSPGAVDSFISAYKYGVSRNGLALGSAQALEFARRVSSISAT